jgi:hypothetical protein
MEPSAALPGACAYPDSVGRFGSFASNRGREAGDVGLGPVAPEPRLLPSSSDGVAFLLVRSLSGPGVWKRSWLGGARFNGRSSGYGSGPGGGLIGSGIFGGGLIGNGTLGGLVGGAGNDGIGGGRENAGACALELPAESVRGGGLFCILRGPTVGVSGAVSVGRRNSSSSGLPCLRPSMAGGEVVGTTDVFGPLKKLV